MHTDHKVNKVHLIYTDQIVLFRFTHFLDLRIPRFPCFLDLLASQPLCIYIQMMVEPAQHIPHEHPLDVLSFFLAQLASGQACALAMLTDTLGGAVRANGALMAIAQSGQSCGYLSGGCIDADIRLQAHAALKDGAPKQLRYGKGSPFLDITLPCGGAIDITILPDADRAKIERAVTALSARQAVTLALMDTPNAYIATYRPKLRLRIAGRSADPVALAKLSVSAGIETVLWSADLECLKNTRSVPSLSTQTLSSPAALPAAFDDDHTAFVLMMHDQDWEAPLLGQALNGSAFYIGAVGSPHTHTKRCAHLRQQGLSEADIARIKGPIGLVPSMRDASMLAISTLAEIIGAYHAIPVSHPTDRDILEHV